ncbi:MAG: ARMT1-like domain-containing protein [bacterium]|nr:ARMT1-like domain-containing protein [bacterium]
MKAGFECMPCILTQALNTARLVTDDRETMARVMAAAHDYSRDMNLALTPTTLCTPLYRMIEELTGDPDPYAGMKRKYNDLALELYPEACKLLEDYPDRLHTALKLAVAGNIIDLGIGMKFDLAEVVAEVAAGDFAVDDYDSLQADLKTARSLLILGDNTGEIVFDKILVEELRPYGLVLTYAVKAGPIINDSTLEDASYVGLDGLCRVITSGSNGIGTPLAEVSREFREVFDRADIVIGKGHGHYESLSSSTPRPVYCLLRAKCSLVAASLGINLGGVAFKLIEPVAGS